MVAKLKDFQILFNSYCHDIQYSFSNKTVTQVYITSQPENCDKEKGLKSFWVLVTSSRDTLSVVSGSNIYRAVHYSSVTPELLVSVDC